MKKAIAIMVLIVALAPAQAKATECKDAVESYNSALSEVSYTLKRYANCVSASAGQDDCSTEFRRLKYAQANLESAVMEISSYCRS
ncbi:hypothetical protein ACFFF7_02580 [Novosphingobium aquiterrae]|uniref:UrcA family protein n=1 Tax=Novosphingobium aquiterrae TaxID=624388 RepID=A0ABV6PEP7_9SPHN